MTGARQTVIGAQIARQRRRRAAVGLASALALAALAALAAWLWLSPPGAGGPAPFAYDGDARAGQAPYKTDEEVRAELERVVEEGMFDISIAGRIEFASPDAPGTAYIENVPGNRYDMRVTVALDSTGEEVYRSGALAPGTYVESIRLARPLDPGTHQATATFEALDPETHEAVGTAGAKVALAVGGG